MEEKKIKQQIIFQSPLSLTKPWIAHLPDDFEGLPDDFEGFREQLCHYFSFEEGTQGPENDEQNKVNNKLWLNSLRIVLTQSVVILLRRKIPHQ